MNKVYNMTSKYDNITRNLAEKIAKQNSGIDLQPEIAEFRCFFEEIKANYSGYWEAVEESLIFLETAAQKAEYPYAQPLILTGLQQLICDSELCLGAYFWGSKMISDEKRFQYHILPDEKAGRGILTVVALLDNAESLDLYRGNLMELVDSGHNVLVVLQSDDDANASEEPFPVCRLPRRLGLQALFDLAFYSCETEYFMLAYKGICSVKSISVSLQTMCTDTGIAYVLLENSTLTGDLLMPGFLECGISGIYRVDAAKKIGSLDRLFSDENYISEDYLIRARSIGYSALSLCCPFDACWENNFSGSICRDEEAMLRKHGKSQAYRFDKTFVPEFFNHFGGAIAGLQYITLLHDGNDRIAAMLRQLIEKKTAKDAIIEVKDAETVEDSLFAETLVFCFPICYCRDFDRLLCRIADITNAKLIVFFDKNYLSASTVEEALSDRAYFPAEAVTIWHRKKLRDMTADKGYDVSFSRIADKNSGKIQQNISTAFPESSDMIVKNIQTEYYTYVCVKSEGR